MHILFNCGLSSSKKTSTNNLVDVNGIHLMYYTHDFVKPKNGEKISNVVHRILKN